MNLIDLFFLLIFIGMLALGFFQGMIRLTVLLVAFYLSLVLASLYFQPLGLVLYQRFNTRGDVGNYVGFAMLLFFGFILLSLAGLYTFRYARMPGALQYVDRIGGVVMGLVLAVLFIGIFAILLWNLMILRDGRNIDFPLMRALGNSVGRSFLLRYFANYLLPLVYNFVDPILPDGVELIFVVQT